MILYEKSKIFFRTAMPKIMYNIKIVNVRSMCSIFIHSPSYPTTLKNRERRNHKPRTV